MKINRKSLDSNPEFCYNTLMFNNYSEVQKMEKQKISKKELIREIMEIDSPLLGGGDFNMESLSRTNIQNLELILRMLKA